DAVETIGVDGNHEPLVPLVASRNLFDPHRKSITMIIANGHRIYQKTHERPVGSKKGHLLGKQM
ncbi:hypothetical protein HAX54_015549, partial [Datura stramonium]|nr:hypothetical protein [Datura stramonium]